MMTKYYDEKKLFDLIGWKGIYPYEWVDDAGKFNEQQFPIETFYNNLKSEGSVKCC